jgi:hypothetical protein
MLASAPAVTRRTTPKPSMFWYHAIDSSRFGTLMPVWCGVISNTELVSCLVA